MANMDIFSKIKPTLRHFSSQDNSFIEADVREDEEQFIKLQEIIDIFVAAGYFRARIKGLSSFDKVVGGMVWCIESCNIDIDVDLLFQENLTIGNKIALTEKIVSVLSKMKCPHRVEPHQIQGLDFIHIFPVIQWLVKTSLEYREERSEAVKSYAVMQFNKQFELNKTKDIDSTSSNIKTIKEFYRPQRFYRRKNSNLEGNESKIQVTLLEYGLRGSYLLFTNSSDVSQDLIDDQKKEELQIEQLMKNLANETLEDLYDNEELNKEDEDKLIKHYLLLQAEMNDGTHNLNLRKKVQIYSRRKELLSKQQVKLSMMKETMDNEITDITSTVNELDRKLSQAVTNLQDISIDETQDQETLQKVEELVLLHEHLKEQEQQFREYCKGELLKLQQLIEITQNSKVPEGTKIKCNNELESEVQNLKMLRLKVAKKNRAISLLQRQLDEIPSRAELAQYQRRFLELYNQVSAKYKETKQYYTLYNTLDDTRMYIRKELNLLNSILDSYPEAIQSASGRSDFLRQFETVLEGVKMTSTKVETSCKEERFKRDQLSQRLLNLVEQQRRYVVAVRQLGIECAKSETMTVQGNA